jgi:transcriptional regulator with XRE-family HTH domain
VDDQRVGRTIRALRRRLGWRQLDLAVAAACSQGEVSLIERGHLRSLPRVRAVLAALDASLELEVRWRAGALERLLDEDHARLVGLLSALLERHGWEVRAEVTYSEYGERGSFDLLAWHPALNVLLVIEVKTDLTSAEATLRKLDEKVRLATEVASKRFGWAAQTTSWLLAMPDYRTLRRRVSRHAALFDKAFPMRGLAVRRWLRDPIGGMAGLWFVSGINGRSAIQARGGRERVRACRLGRKVGRIADRHKRWR